MGRWYDRRSTRAVQYCCGRFPFENVNIALSCTVASCWCLSISETGAFCGHRLTVPKWWYDALSLALSPRSLLLATYRRRAERIVPVRGVPNRNNPLPFHSLLLFKDLSRSLFLSLRGGEMHQDQRSCAACISCACMTESIHR